MKSLLFLIFIVITIKASCQYPLLTDSNMVKALNLDGYKDTGVGFKEFNAKTLNGRTYSEDSLKNKITFISFWFEACPPCIAEFDALNNLYNKYKKTKDFQFLSFTFETSENATAIANRYHLEFPILTLEMHDLYRLMFNLGFPTVIITDTHGKISFIECGGFTDKEEANKRVDSLFSKEIERLLVSK